MFILNLPTAGFILCLALPASGALVTQSRSFTPRQTGFSIPNALEFDRFDPAIGQLDSVSFSIRSTILTEGTVTNFSSTPLLQTMGGFASSYVALPFGLPEIFLGPQFTIPPFTLAAGETKGFSGIGVRSVTETFNTPATIAAFTGIEEFFIPRVRANSTIFWRSPGGIPASVSRVGFEIDLTYRYSAIPEPSTALFGLALGGPCLIRRRLKRGCHPMRPPPNPEYG